ncbi:squalene/phytoene synthase family protein [Streptomyces sp. NPDC093094]|uniref:squalene/phytoene synthase family protein n=1 Tax=Streptomyces sp. NPDC093094 TaxID=3366026 RepID=UPI0037FEB9B9
MTAWNRCLDAAGIREPELRSAYGAQRAAVRSHRRSSYIAARVLLPPALQPHALAATAFMDHGDSLLDTGPKAQRVMAWADWEQRVRKALETGHGDDPLIRTLLGTVDRCPRLRGAVEEYLDTAGAELDFAGFAGEADYQAYLDAYSLPAFMLVGTLLAPETGRERYRSACRGLIEGSQRLDFVNDLAEDLREGRLGIPEDALRRFSVSVADLRSGHEPSALGRLVTEQVRTARAALDSAREVAGLAAPSGRPLFEALVDIELLTADAVLARGTRLLGGPASPPLTGTLRALLRARRRA